MSTAPPSLRARLQQWLHDRPDDTVLCWVFGVMLASTASVLTLDYAELNARAPDKAWVSPDLTHPSIEPLPPSRRADGDERAAPVRKSDAKLEAPMSFELVGNGRLKAVGTIRPGTAEAFAAEIAKRGDYVKTVVLQSPGGSVSDALDMGRLIRAKQFATEVEAGHYCASSCPLVFAGGVERRVGEKAAIGVHQIFASGRTASLLPADGMESAQRVSAKCQKYLREMGVDLQVWLHAMETPKDQLYYFKRDELLTLKLATQYGAGVKSVEARAK